MKILKIFDEKDYDDEMGVYEKHAVRAVIMREGKIAVQKSTRGECKILGGGMEEGESRKTALLREVKEESGLVVIPSSVKEIGEMQEMRRDRFKPEKKFFCHSYFYRCDAEIDMVQPQMTASEIAQGFTLMWLTPEEIIQNNEEFLIYPWIKRDTEMIRMIYEGKINWQL